MADYNFFADILDTYQAMPDVLKALWLVTPPMFFITLIVLLRLSVSTPRHWYETEKDENEMHPDTLYRIYRLKGDHFVAVPIHRSIDNKLIAGPEDEKVEEDERE